MNAPRLNVLLLALLVAVPALAGEDGAAAPAAAESAAIPTPAQELARLEEELTVRPDDVDLLLAKGRLLRRQQDWAGAAAVYDRVLGVQPGHAQAAALQSLVLLQRAAAADAGTAVRLLERALRLAPDSELHRLALMRALAREGGHAARLVELYNALPVGASLPLDVMRGVAAACRETGRAAEAAGIYRAILGAVPGDADAALGLALTLIDAGDFPGALEAADRGLASQPRGVLLLMARAAALWKGGMPLSAVETFDRILAIDPRHADARNLKAQLLAELGFVTLARTAIEEQPGLIRPEVRRYVETAMAEARTAWQEDALATNILERLVPDRLLALCYHAVADDAPPSPLSTRRASLVRHIEYLRTHGYRFVSAGDVLAAQRLERDLPPNPVLLTFDHGYASFLTEVLPVLELYGLPAVVTIAPGWIQHGPPVDLPGPLMGWEQVAEVAASPLVTLALQPDALFPVIPANPQGNTALAAVTRLYRSDTGAYETEEAFRDRIRHAIETAQQLVDEHLDQRVRVLAWPHGARNQLATAEALRLGFSLQLGLAARPGRTDTARLDRVLVLNDPGVLDFIDLAKSDRDARPPLRAARLSLDLLDTRSPRQFEERLALAVRRLAALPVNTVLLAGYADADRDGTADAAYFPTRVMGVKRDILNHVVQRLHAAGLEVFVSLPVLSITRPATTHNDSLLVMETRAGAVRPATGIQRRLSPFHPEAAALMQQVYRDLAAHVPLDGIVFEDDAFLTDREDWNPAAQAACRAELGFDPGQVPSLTEADSRAWTALKTRTLSAFVRALADEVRRYRPDLRTVRALYAPVVNRPRAEDWLAQNFDESIEQHDYVLVEAHVELQDVSRPERWLRELVEVVGERPDGLGRTVFDLQAYDWERGRWVRDRDIGERLEVLRAAGAAHLAYGPDDPVAGRPDAKTLATGLAPAR